MKKKTNQNNKAQYTSKQKSKVVRDNLDSYSINNRKSKPITYSDEKIGNIKIIKDFLPAPEELILKDSTVKVTLNLSKSSIIFFKGLAEKHGSQYQKIIRIILDSYSSNYNK